jgi:hypothetical protein
MHRLDQKLNCRVCGTIYLDIPPNVMSHSPIYCSSCGLLLGRWDDLEKDFNVQGGQDGVFKLHNGQIERLD